MEKNKEITRRDAIKTMGAAAAVVATGAVGVDAIAAETSGEAKSIPADSLKLKVLLINPWICEDLEESASECEVLLDSSLHQELCLIYRVLEVYRKWLWLEALIAEKSCDISENVVLNSYVTC